MDICKTPFELRFWQIYDFDEKIGFDIENANTPSKKQQPQNKQKTTNKQQTNNNKQTNNNQKWQNYNDNDNNNNNRILTWQIQIICNQ